VPGAHTCNLSYLGGRDQEDQGSKPTWTNKFKRPYLKKNPSLKKQKTKTRAGGVAQGIGPEFKPHTEEKKKKKPRMWQP
jgi:hypothetical protein